MSNKIITDLNSYTSSQVKSYDLMWITDVDHQETKKITPAELGNYISALSGSKYRTGSYSGSFVGTTTSASHLIYPNSSTASFAVTASYVKNAVTASLAVTASYALSAGTGSNTLSFKENISQSTVPFSTGDALYKNGSTFYTASATSSTAFALANEVVGVIERVVDSGNFTICYGGIIDFGASPPDYFTGSVYGSALFLTGSSGKMVNSDPSITNINQISKPLLIKLDASRALITNQRGIFEDTASMAAPTSASYSLTASYALNGGATGSGTGGNNYYVDNTPVGSIIAMASGSAPRTYVLCDGAYVRVRDYSVLATTIAQPFGSTATFGKRYLLDAGSGTFTEQNDYSSNGDNWYFKLPDIRGVFVRGLNNGSSTNAGTSAYDTGRVLGSIQADALESHNHTVTIGTGNPGSAGVVAVNASTATTLNTNAAGSSETRPVNISLNYYIKYDNDVFIPADLSGHYSVTGDVNGSLDNTHVIKLQGVPISATTPVSGALLIYNGSQWVPSSITATNSLNLLWVGLVNGFTTSKHGLAATTVLKLGGTNIVSGVVRNSVGNYTITHDIGNVKYFIEGIAAEDGSGLQTRSVKGFYNRTFTTIQYVASDDSILNDSYHELRVYGYN